MSSQTTMRQQKQDKTSSPWKWFMGAEFALLIVGLIIGVLAYWVLRS